MGFLRPKTPALPPPPPPPEPPSSELSAEEKRELKKNKIKLEE